jgi:predicted dehydrogenase
LAGTALLSAISARSFAGEDNTIKIALVGCGGRGTGAAANALSTQGPTRLCAMADVFENRLQSSRDALAKQFPKQVGVTPERQFVGMDGYRKAIDAVGPGGLVLLATPPAFRPMHVEYAVAKGCHVFMEKSFGVDGPGVRRMLKAGEAATQKNLKIAGGLMSRHFPPLEEAIRRIHQGAIGEIITLWAYREHDPAGFTPKSPAESELAHQIRNYSSYTWLNGSFFLDWLIHDIDVCCWAKDAWPVSAQGHGGRQVRTSPDQMFDHYAVEYSFADGTRMFVQGRHIAGCWGFCGNVIDGSRGSAVGSGWGQRPAIYKGHKRTAQDLIWDFKGPVGNDYQIEHDLLFEAIRQDKPYNEAERCAKAAMAGIIGRMAAESGKMILWDEAMASNLELAPGLDQYTMASQPPALPDAQGRYPIAMPGMTKVL